MRQSAGINRDRVTIRTSEREQTPWVAWGLQRLHAPASKALDVPSFSNSRLNKCNRTRAVKLSLKCGVKASLGDHNLGLEIRSTFILHES